MMDSPALKDEGNKHFKCGDYEDALVCYTKALKLISPESQDAVVLLKNRAACHLHLEKYTQAKEDCSKALEISPNDPKCLYRRCQALEKLGSIEEAYVDAMRLVKVDPKNTAIQSVLRRLNPIVQDKMQKRHSTDNKVTQMFDIVFNNLSGTEEKRRQAANNLIALAKEEAGAEKIYQNNGVLQLERLIDLDKDKELRLTGLRVLASMVRHSDKRAIGVFDQVGLKKLCIWLGSGDEEQSLVGAHLIQQIIISITNIDALKQEREKHETLRKTDPCCKLRPYVHLFDKISEGAMKIVDTIFPALIVMLHHGKVSACGRDNAMELIIKFVTRIDGCGWPKKFIEAGGLQNLLEVAGTIREHGGLAVSPNSRMHVSLCLSKIYDDLVSDQERETFVTAVDAYFTDMFGDNIMESKVEAVMALSALLQGPVTVGNSILGRKGVLELIVAMADSGNAIHTKYAVEALVHSSSKRDKCSAVIKEATPVLKQLYQSQNDTIKVRALVGLCKLGSIGGSDASTKSFAEGSTQTLAKACRKYLCNTAKDTDLRKWAAEGLAYLTLDADVKEDLAADSEALKALVDLTKVADKGIVYPIAQVLVNVTNSFDKKEIDPEMLELAKFAQQHVPEAHEKDDEAHIKARVKRLVEAGVVNALVCLSKTDSKSTRELLARVYLAVCADTDHRGLVVQQGGAKALIPLSTEGTDVGKVKAAQALAKVAITNNPEIAFPGQRACEIVRPLLGLLSVERSALENYEALMALTNLASTNDTVRQRIVQEKGVSRIEYYGYEDHDQLKLASFECMCNLAISSQVQEIYLGENDRIKMLVLNCGDEDEKLVRAVAGTLAILAADQVEICHKIISSTEAWFEILQCLAAHELPDLQYRGVYILNCIVHADKALASKIVDSSMLEVLMAVSRLDEPERQSSRECALDALQQAVEYQLIHANQSSPS